MLNKQSGNTNLNTALGVISPGFEINDLGFQYRADQINWHLMAGYSWLEPKGWVRERGLSLGVFKNWDWAGGGFEQGAGLFYDVSFANFWGASGMLFYNPERDSFRASRGGPVMRMPEYREFQLSLYTNWQRPWVVEVGGTAWSSGDGSDGLSLWGDVTLRPLSSLRLSLGVRRSFDNTRAQWVDNVDDPAMTATYGTRHVFGRMDYDELSFPVRVDWTFTPGLTLQSYVQPLFAAARYDRFKELAPRRQLRLQPLRRGRLDHRPHRRRLHGRSRRRRPDRGLRARRPGLQLQVPEGEHGAALGVRGGLDDLPGVDPGPRGLQQPGRLLALAGLGPADGRARGRHRHGEGDDVAGLVGGRPPTRGMRSSL